MNLLRDVRYGIRTLFKTPGLSAIAIVTIALGIGLTTHTFSIVYGSVIRGLPYDGADRLVFLTQSNAIDGWSDRSIPYHDFLDIRAEQSTLEGVGGLYNGTVNLADSDQRPERYLGAWVSWNTLQLTGASPVLGRLFQEGEDLPGADPTVVLSHDIWQNRYGSDPNILGRTIRANGEQHTIIGVMPEKFKFPFDNYLWLPLGLDVSQFERGNGTYLQVPALLRPGVSLDEARAELATIAARLQQSYPETNENVMIDIGAFTEEYMPAQITAVLWVMLIAVFGVLLIACANVANLLLARAVNRSKEIAVRSALGASRGIIVRQLLIESLVLAVIGGTLGIALSYVGIAGFNAWIIDIQKPFWIEIALFPPVLAFAIVITFVAAVASGTIPAFKASGAQVHEILKDASRGSSFRMSRVTTALVVGEIAVSCALLIAAGFMVKSIINIKNVDLGFETAGVFTARVGLPITDYPDEEARLRFHDQLLAELEALPRVESASLGWVLPANDPGMYWYGVEDETYLTDRDYPFANYAAITPAFFKTFGTAVIQGREFTSQDRDGNLTVAIVNESFARRHFAASAVGRRLRFGRSDSERPWLTIVGVVPDLYVGGGVGGIGSDDRIQEHIYAPLAQDVSRFVSLAVKVAGDPLTMAAPIREVVSGIDPNLPTYEVDSMEGVIETNTWAFGLFGTLFAIFGVISLFMSAVGLYGVMAFAVQRRRQEMGIRMALGAYPKDIVRLVFRNGFKQLGVGMVIGVGIGAGLSQPLRVILFGVDTTDVTVYLAIVVTLAAAGALACWLPATRATRVNLVEALLPE